MADKDKQEAAIAAARDAGLDTSELERQVAERAEGEGRDLAAKIERLEATLERRVPEPPPTPEQREQDTGRRLLEHLHASSSKWFSPSSSGGGDRG